MTTDAPVLAAEDFPALHESANEQSLLAQKSFLLWFKIRLAGLVVAAIGGAIVWTTGIINIGGGVAFLAFAAALAAELILAVRRPERIWYEGRAAAESAKTLTWRYMVRGEPFGGDDKEAHDDFLHELKDVLHDLDALPVHALSRQHLQISPKMREIRALPFAQRRGVYLTQRIQDQQGWYATKAEWNAKHANAWMVTSIVLEFLGLIGAAVKAVTYHGLSVRPVKSGWEAVLLFDV